MPNCDMDHTACELAEQSKVPPIDCGVVTPADDIATWEAVHTCVIESAAASEGFKAIFDFQGIDSVPRYAFVGQVGFVYNVSRLHQDLGGVLGGDPISQATCSALVAVEDCTVAVNEHCIECVDFTLLDDPLCVP